MMRPLYKIAIVAAVFLAFAGSAMADWNAYVIRLSATNEAPETKANNSYGVAATEFVTAQGSQKAGWGTSALDGMKVGDITRLKIARLDDRSRFATGSGPYVAPYFNIWVTDGNGKYAVLGNEPSDSVFQLLYNSGYDLSFADLADKPCKVYENADKSWLPNDGVGLTFADVAHLRIEAPPAAQLATGWTGLGGGAPRELGTNKAYGINWVFGDTLTNYVSGAEGYVVAQPMVAAKGLSGAGHRLVQTQNPDGGWGWPLVGGSAANILGPTGKGLAEAYKATNDPAMRAALLETGTYLLSKTAFSMPDGYLALQLDLVFGGTVHRDHVNAGFFDLLAVGQYNRQGTLHSTESYLQLLHNVRTGSTAGMGAWDVGMGIAGAAACGVDDVELQKFISATLFELNRMEAENKYAVLGLAGAVYGLACVGADVEVTSGVHAGTVGVAGLAEKLVGYQLPSGGFTWQEGLEEEDVQATAYALLALAQTDAYAYWVEIKMAADYLKSVQLATGGWGPELGGSGENNEITGEAAWAIAVADSAMLSLIVQSTLYVQPSWAVGDNKTVEVSMDVAGLPRDVVAVQAFVGYQADKLTATNLTLAGVWNDLFHQAFPTGGVDMVLGFSAWSDPPATQVGTSADGALAMITFQTGSFEGLTQVVFRHDVSEVESTFFADLDANALWPTKVNSQWIMIDGTPPTLEIVSITQAGFNVASGSGSNALQGTVEILVSAVDPISGGVASNLAMPPSVIVKQGATEVVAALAGGDPEAGEFLYTFTVDSTTANGQWQVDVAVADRADNASSVASAFNVNKNQLTGEVELQGFTGTTRVVTFVATGTVKQTWVQELSFTNGVAGYTLTDVADGVTGLSANTDWSLRRKLAASFSSGQAAVDFVGGSMLLGGDLNGSNSINVLDYAVLKTNWFGNNAVADITGDGVINMLDYDILKQNWFAVGDAE